jgi:hypothetical protein
MPPLRLSQAQLDAVFDAARPLAVASRDAFLLDLAAALQGIPDPGDGAVARAIRAVQRMNFDPPQFDELVGWQRRARRAPSPRRVAAHALFRVGATVVPSQRR